MKGSVSVHFDNIKATIPSMVEFITKRILAESVKYMEYREKAERKSKELLNFYPYLATGISNRFFTRLQSSFSQQSFTAAQLLNHFPAKKSNMVVIEYEVPAKSSSEKENDDKYENSQVKKDHPDVAKKPGISRKCSRSMAYAKVYLFHFPTLYI
jgi:hypothetical protein